jgi:hypothetical protein
MSLYLIDDKVMFSQHFNERNSPFLCDGIRGYRDVLVSYAVTVCRACVVATSV